VECAGAPKEGSCELVVAGAAVEQNELFLREIHDGDRRSFGKQMVGSRDQNELVVMRV
jgi:hypothetical protein